MQLNRYLNQLGIPGALSATALLAAWLSIATLLTGQLRYSVLLAVAAFVFDSLDGYAARKLGRESEFGRQLDSMVDLVGYSVYAGLLTSQVLIPGWMGLVTGYAIVLFGILRLINFNVEGYVESGEVKYYRGVVVCHLSLATICLLLLTTHVQLNPFVTMLVLTALAILQVSNIRTRKTGMLPVWYGLCGLIVAGAVAWLP